MSHKLQHYMNPLHVYCRLRDLGFSKKKSLFVGRLYERILNLFKKTKNEE